MTPQSKSRSAVGVDVCAHQIADGNAFSGINVEEGGVMDMRAANVLEPQRVVEQAIQSATETAIMILRIDDVISSKSVSGGDMMGGMDDFHM